MQSGKDKKGLSTTWWVGVLLLTIVGASLRFHHLSAQPLWYDEVLAVQTSQASWADMPRMSRASSSLPIYFAVLRAFVGGDERPSEGRCRALSALAGALSVPVFAILIFVLRRNETESLMGGLLLAINPLHIWYSQETRAYALMLLIGLVAWICYEAARRTDAIAWWIGYVMVSVAAAALHKTGVMFALLCGLQGLWDLKRRGIRVKECVSQAVLGFIMVVLFSLNTTAVPYDRPSSLLELPYTLLTYIGGYSFGPSVYEIQSLGTKEAVGRNIGQLAAAAVVLVTVGLAFLAHARALVRTREFYLVCVTVGVAFIGAAVSTYAYNTRYVLPGLFGFLALVGFAGVGRRIWGSLAVAGVLLINVASLSQWFSNPKYGKDDSRGLASWIAGHEGSFGSALVVHYDGRKPLEWYLRDEKVRSRIRYKSGDEMDVLDPLPDLMIVARKHRLSHPEELIKRYREASGEVVQMSCFRGYEVYARRLDPAAPSR